jgi:hypothetical protein
MAESKAPGADTYFLSYSRSDETFALRLANDIRAEGVNIWVDQLDIRPSEHWDRAIERAVRDCRGILVIISPRSIASDNVADEISFAIDNGKRVFPVMIEPCRLPLRMTRMQVIDATGNYREALRHCVDELRSGRAGSPPEYESDGARRLATAIEPQAAQAEERITKAELDTLSKALGRYLGPIAALLAKRESRSCRSVEELKQRLASSIPNASERSQFLQDVSAK